VYVKLKDLTWQGRVSWCRERFCLNTEHATQHSEQAFNLVRTGTVTQARCNVAIGADQRSLTLALRIQAGELTVSGLPFLSISESIALQADLEFVLGQFAGACPLTFSPPKHECEVRTPEVQGRDALAVRCYQPCMRCSYPGNGALLKIGQLGRWRLMRRIGADSGGAVHRAQLVAGMQDAVARAASSETRP
jgi:hypothetical protein